MKPEEIEKLAEVLLQDLSGAQLIVLKADKTAVKSTIKDIIAKNFAEEQQIEQEARKLLAANKPAGNDLDEHKMFLLIKQKLAQQKGFVL
jgi:hypothetical protein